jgi:chaperonin GroES
MKRVKMKPLSDCVLIEQDEAKQGLIIVKKEKLASGVIVATGPGKMSSKGVLQEMELSVGDHVLFGEYSGQKVELEGKEYLMMRQPDVIGILNG